MGKRYNELYDENRKLQSKYDYIKRQNEKLREENKKQEEIINITKQINALYEEKINKLTNRRNIDNEKRKILIDTTIELTEKILNFQKILEGKYSDWCETTDTIWRYKNGRIISYKIPYPFVKGWEHITKIDNDLQMIEFLHPDGNDRLRPFKIPIEIFQLIGGNLFSKASDRYTPHVDPLYEDEEDVKRILIKKDVSLKGKFIDNLIGFVLFHQKGTYTMKEFGNYCGFANRETRRQYHNKLKKAGMVKEIGKDLYEFVRVKT